MKYLKRLGFHARRTKPKAPGNLFAEPAVSWQQKAALLQARRWRKLHDLAKRKTRVQ